MDVEVVAGEIIEEDLSEAPTGEEKNAQGKSREKKRNPGERKSMTKNTAWMHYTCVGFFSGLARLRQALPGNAKRFPKKKQAWT